MAIRIVIFLAFVSVTVIANTFLIWFAYKAFANFTSKVTETVSEFEASSETKEWLTSLQSASEQAIAVTEATKLKMAELGPVLDGTQERHREALIKVDSALETAADQITTNAQKVRDAVAKPAFAIVTFAAGLTQVLENMESEE